MTGPVGTLERVESHVPDRRVAIEATAAELGLSRAKLALFRKVHGLHTLHVDEGPLLDLLLPAARRALASAADPAHVRWVVHAHAIHEVAPATVDMAGRLRDALGLGHAEAFALTQQNCATGLGALDVAVALLRDGAPEDRVLVVTGEKAHSRLVRVVPGTVIMGDAAAACLVAADGEGDRLLARASRTLGEYADLVSLPPELAAQYGKVYAPVLAEVIEEAVARAGLALDDIDLLVPHNVNLLAWRNTCAELGVATDRVFLDNVPRFSHCFASDPFLNYTTLRDTGRLTPDRHYVLAAVGAGATFTAVALTHRPAPRGKR